MFILSMKYNMHLTFKHFQIAEQLHIISIQPTQLCCYRILAQNYLRCIAQPIDLNNAETQEYINNAENILKKAIDIDSSGEDGILWTYLGYINLQFRHDIIRAYQYYERYVEITSNNAMKVRINQLLQQLQEQYDNAMAVASEEPPDSPEEEDVIATDSPEEEDAAYSP